MPKQLWPNDIAAILNEKLGKDRITAPISFATARGLSYFNMDCDDRRKVADVREFLVKHNILPSVLIKEEFFATSTEAHYGKLQFHVAKDVANDFALLFAGNIEAINALLDAETLPYKTYRALKEPTDFEGPKRPKEPTYGEIFGSPWDISETYVPEETARIGHAIKTKGPAGVTQDMLMWFIPPQNPVGVNFAINEEGKLDIANAEQAAALKKEYEAVASARRAIMEGHAGRDRMFDVSKGKIVVLAKGAVYNWVKAGGTSNLGPATYYNPDAGKYYILSEPQIERLKQKPELGRTVQYESRL